MMKTLFYLLAGVLLFAGCLDTDDNLQPVILGPIDLSDLQEGQQSRFISYEMNCDSMEFQWTGDTLVVRVVSDGENFFLAEWLTDSSRTVRIDGENPIEMYPIESRNDIVTIPERAESKLFFFYGSDSLQLDKPDLVETEQYDCWFLIDSTLFEGDEVCHAEAFDLGPISLRDVTVVSCVPVVELDAYLLYDRNTLYASHQIETLKFHSNILGGTSTGWVRLEE